MLESDPLPACAGETTRLLIEPLAPHHVDLLAGPLLEPAVYRWIEPHRDEASFRTFCEALMDGPSTRFSDQIWWNHAIIHRVTGQGVGRLEATFIGDQVEVAYLLGSRWWRQGLGSEALKWLVDEIIRQHPAPEIWATVHPENSPSQRLLLRNRFVRQTVFPETLRSYDPGDYVYRFDRSETTSP